MRSRSYLLFAVLLVSAMLDEPQPASAYEPPDVTEVVAQEPTADQCVEVVEHACAQAIELADWQPAVRSRFLRFETTALHRRMNRTRVVRTAAPASPRSVTFKSPLPVVQHRT